MVARTAKKENDSFHQAGSAGFFPPDGRKGGFEETLYSGGTDMTRWPSDRRSDTTSETNQLTLHAIVADAEIQDQILGQQAKITVADVWSKLRLAGTPGPLCQSPLCRNAGASSFEVSSDDRHWWCRATRQGGDALDFVAAVIGRTRDEALDGYWGLRTLSGRNVQGGLSQGNFPSNDQVERCELGTANGSVFSSNREALQSSFADPSCCSAGGLR